MDEIKENYFIKPRQHNKMRRPKKSIKLLADSPEEIKIESPIVKKLADWGASIKSIPKKISDYAAKNVYKVAIAITIMVLCIIAFIFFPRGAGFYDNNLFPQLQILDFGGVPGGSEEDVLANAKKEIMEITQFEPWRESEDIQVAPLVYCGAERIIISSFVKENIYKVLTQINDLKFAYVMRVARTAHAADEEGQSECKLLSDDVLTCHIPVFLSDKKKCSLWVCGGSKYYVAGAPIIFDSGRAHLIENKGSKNKHCIILVLGILRPKNIPAGISKIEKAEEEIIKFFDK